MMDSEIRFNLHTIVLLLAWLATASLLAAGCWLDEWRLAAWAVVCSVVAGVLSVQRDNNKTRRVVRAVVRELPEGRVRGVL